MEADSVRRMEGALSLLLKVGVLLSGTLVLLGLAIMAATGDTSYSNGVLDLRWMIFGDPFFEPSHIIYLGFITLIATPVIRIVASVALFHKAHDRAFAVITATVLLILVISFLLGVG